MPTGAPCQPSCVPKPPRRFQNAAVDDEELPSGQPGQRGRALVGLPAPRPSSARSPFGSAPGSPRSVARSERSCALRPRSSARGPPPTGVCGAAGSASAASQSASLTRGASVGAPCTPCGAASESRAPPPTAVHGTTGVGTGASPRASPKTPSIMDLVNQAAREAELEETRSMRRSVSMPARLHSAGSPGIISSGVAAPPTPKQGGQQQPQPAPQEQAQQQARSSSASPRASSAGAATARSHSGGSAAAAVTASSPRSGRSSINSSSTSMPGTPTPMSSSGGLPPVSGSRSGGASAAAAATLFADARYQQAALAQHHAAAARAGSECGSEDGSLTPPGSSLCSSASSSSLCSAASYGSNASTSSGGSGRPKSILLTRSSTSSLGSGASSPRCMKRVTWKDGQAHRETGGRDLVAVRLLEDGPDMRRLRRDTWPERPGARREAAEEAAAAAAAAAKQQQAAAAAPSSLARAIELLQEPARLFDWRDKLKALQQERRAQRLGMVQAAWQAQQQQQQQDTEMTPAGGSTELQAAAEARPENGGAKALSGATIRIEAVAASVTAGGGC